MFDKVFKLKVYKENKDVAKAILKDHDGYERFFIYEDEPICSLSDLTARLAVLEPAKYLYHANQEKNDFAMWVRAVLGDHKLADQLLKAKNLKQAAQQCRERLAELKNIIYDK